MKLVYARRSVLLQWLESCKSTIQKAAAQMLKVIRDGQLQTIDLLFKPGQSAAFNIDNL